MTDKKSKIRNALMNTKPPNGYAPPAKKSKLVTMLSGLKPPKSGMGDL